MEGGVLRVGLGCGREEGIGSTLVWYMRRAGAAATEAWDAAATSVGPMARLPWAVVAGEGTTVKDAAVGGGAAAVVTGQGLDPPAGGGEEWHTRGLKLCPPRIFTMVGLEKERRGWDGLE